MLGPFTLRQREPLSSNAGLEEAAIHIVISVASLSAAGGGPSRSTSMLSSALAESGVRVTVVALDGSCPADLCLPCHLVQTRLVRAQNVGCRLAWSQELRRELLRCFGTGELTVLHDNGLWLPSNHTAVAAAARESVPLVISPRGMLEPWALAHKAWKKRFAWWVYQLRDLMSSKVLHATSEPEAKNLRRLGLAQPIAVIPNGVHTPAVGLSERTLGDPPVRTALFLGRIYPVKGLLNLVHAWAQVAPEGWRCVIAGPDESGHQAEVERAIRDQGLEKQFHFPGSIQDDKKWELLAKADLFVLPSFSENFGIAVAEALASGVPVITTKSTPWPELVTRRCGWWVDIGVEPLAAALREAMALSDGERREMGLRGRRLVEEKYSWPRIAREMLSVYEWVLGKGERPACVV
jgi:glycosyltransferase involved in cell wall biosynthesis